MVLGTNQTLTDNGSMTFSQGDTVNVSGYYGTGQIVVNGSLSATGTTFVNGGNTSQIVVNSGGRLIASNTTFSIDNLYLDSGSVLESGDLSNNIFATILTAPITDVPLLANNQSFSVVYLTGGLTSGQSVTLDPLGTRTTAGQYYGLLNGLAVSSGASLTIGTGAEVAIGDQQTISVSGQLTVTKALVVIGNFINGSSDGIVVNSGGTMTVTGSSFILNNGNGTENAYLEVSAGGHLTASNSKFSIDNLYLDSASSDQLAVNVLATQLTVNSGASPLSITGNVFSNGTVVAAGDSTATINLGSNYWGTTTTAQIEAKITDHHVNSSLPTVSFSSPLSAASPPGAATNIVASSTTATYNANASQSVTLSASLTSGNVKPNAGTVTFIVTNGTAMVGKPVFANVNSSGSASTTILLPAGTLGGTDTILAIYNGTANYLGSIDASHTVTVNPATVTNAAVNTGDTFSTLGSQTVNLSATVTSTNGTVNEGTETFTILAGSTPIGPAVPVNVVNGAAGTPYTVPAGTRAGTYTIQAVYSGRADFKSVTDTAVLTVGVAATTTFSINTSTTYRASSQTVPLTATVTSTAGTVNEASVTFTVLSGSTPIGPAVPVNVVNGVASTSYTLSAGLMGGTYTIKAVYDGGADFNTSTDTTHTLTVNPAATTTTAANVTTTFSTSAQMVPLTATVTSPAGTVGEGSETFTVLNGTTVIGTATTGNVAGGTVTVSYKIPANTPVDNYTIKAVYNGTAEFLTATDEAHVLTIGVGGDVIIAPITGTGLVLTSSGGGTAPVQQGSQGLSLLSTGVGAGTSSSGHKVHRSSIKINRGPLAIGRPATAKPRSEQKLLVAERRSHIDARRGHRD